MPKRNTSACQVGSGASLFTATTGETSSLYETVHRDRRPLKKETAGLRVDYAYSRGPTIPRNDRSNNTFVRSLVSLSRTAHAHRCSVMRLSRVNNPTVKARFSQREETFDWANVRLIRFSDGTVTVNLCGDFCRRFEQNVHVRRSHSVQTTITQLAHRRSCFVSTMRADREFRFSDDRGAGIAHGHVSKVERNRGRVARSFALSRRWKGKGPKSPPLPPLVPVLSSPNYFNRRILHQLTAGFSFKNPSRGIKTKQWRVYTSNAGEMLVKL